MKKGKKEMNKSFVYFFVFMFLGFLLLATTGVYDNSITGSAINVVPITNAIEGIIKLLFVGFLAPLTNIFGEEDTYKIAVRLVLGVILYILTSFGLKGKFEHEEGNSRNGKIIALVIAILGASLIPLTVIDKLFNPTSGIFGNFLGWILIIVIMVLPIYLLTKMEVDSGMGHFFKGGMYLVLLLIITYIQGSFGSTLKTGGVMDISYGLALIFCAGGFIYNFYNALMPSARDIGENIEDSGGVKGLGGGVWDAFKGFVRGRDDNNRRGERLDDGKKVVRKIIKPLRTKILKFGEILITKDNWRDNDLKRFKKNLKGLIMYVRDISPHVGDYDFSILISTAKEVYEKEDSINEDDIQTIMDEVNTLFTKFEESF